jgi:hypothetical protein
MKNAGERSIERGHSREAFFIDLFDEDNRIWEDS